MRGKYANAAEKRHYLEALERRAEDAERQAASLGAQLTRLQERSAAEVLDLRRELAKTRKQREDGTGAALAEAQEKIRSLLDDLRQAQDDARGTRERWQKAFRNFVSVFTRLGLTGTEALEAVFTMAFNGAERRSGVIMDRVAIDAGLSPDQARALDAARGQRHGGVDIVELLRKKLGPEAERAL